MNDDAYTCAGWIIIGAFLVLIVTSLVIAFVILGLIT